MSLEDEFKADFHSFLGTVGSVMTKYLAAD